MSEWQDMKSAPSGGKSCLVTDGRSVSIGRWYGGEKWQIEGRALGRWREEIVGWQPLPNPPHLDRGTADT